jgi:hypothetical protein
MRISNGKVSGGKLELRSAGILLVLTQEGPASLLCASTPRICRRDAGATRTRKVECRSW